MVLETEPNQYRLIRKGLIIHTPTAQNIKISSKRPSPPPFYGILVIGESNDKCARNELVHKPKINIPIGLLVGLSLRLSYNQRCEMTVRQKQR